MRQTETHELRDIIELCDEAIRQSEELRTDVQASEAVMADE